MAAGEDNGAASRMVDTGIPGGDGGLGSLEGLGAVAVVHRRRGG